ncbi:hypothetical protein ACFL5I_00510 [Planctomycetota bacterium]
MPVSPWSIADNSIAFLVALLTTAVLTYVIWRIMIGFLGAILGKGIAFIGAGFASALVLAAGLKVSLEHLSKAGVVHIIQGVIAGIVDPINAAITPKQFSPLEFILLVSFGLYLCYWLHTRFAPKHTTDDLRHKIDRAIEHEEPKKPTYPY